VKHQQLPGPWSEGRVANLLRSEGQSERHSWFTVRGVRDVLSGLAGTIGIRIDPLLESLLKLSLG